MNRFLTTLPVTLTQPPVTILFLVARDEAGKLYTVRYEAVNAMLLNEFLKEHRKVMEEGLSLREAVSQDRRTARNNSLAQGPVFARRY